MWIPPVLAAEIAAGAWVGHYAPQAADTLDTGLAVGGRYRLRWSERWGAEATLGYTPVGYDPRLAAVTFVGDPARDVVVLASLGGGWAVGPDVPFGELGLGIDMRLFEALDVRADAAIRVDGALDTAFLVAVGPQVHTKRVYDRDGDGVVDRQDLCGEDAEDADGFADADGCPDPDDDGDGLADADDPCRRVPEDRDGFLDADGCPEPDNDGDGFDDRLDACINVAEDPDGYFDGDGCPDEDNDADEVADDDDRCPNVPEDHDAFEDADGCPEPDNDGDGVGDRFDRAPDAPENVNFFEDGDGVPDALPPVLARFVEARPRVRFSGQRLHASGEDLLEVFAAVLQQYPGVRVRVRVSDPDPRLAEARALAVAGFLVERGVAADRLEPEGVDGSAGVEVALVP